MYYVYIIYSEKHDKYYRGFSENPWRRLWYHNAGKSYYTSKYVPWKIVFIQSFDTKSDVLKREKSLKKYSKKQIRELILSHLNEL
jgi:putative endonuclease